VEVFIEDEVPVGPELVENTMRQNSFMEDDVAIELMGRQDKHYQKTLRPPSFILEKLKLKSGCNSISFLV
tara:strand:- start:895 stop:1104 length:210 start_codon:yes stop_codon:yes gene_type:complete